MKYGKGEQHDPYRVDNETCQNETCKFHGMSRYARTYSTGILDSERIILTDNLYISIRHAPYHNETSVYKLDVVVLSDEVILPRALKLDLSNIDRVIDKIRTLLIFS